MNDLDRGFLGRAEYREAPERASTRDPDWQAEEVAGYPAGMRRLLALVALAAVVAPSAASAGREARAAVSVQRHGAFCTPFGCAGAARAPASALAGFAGAAAASVLLARRGLFRPR
jgi:hypothetical protein